MGEGTGRRDWETDFSETAASRSATLLSILKRSLRAREKDLAIVLGKEGLIGGFGRRGIAAYDWGRALGFHSRSSSSSDMMMDGVEV